jgi:hypothetical protein
MMIVERPHTFRIDTGLCEACGEYGGIRAVRNSIECPGKPPPKLSREEVVRK